MNGAILPDPIELVALDPARNIWRRYSITASFDLFGMIVVETRVRPGKGTYRDIEITITYCTI